MAAHWGEEALQVAFPQNRVVIEHREIASIKAAGYLILKQTVLRYNPGMIAIEEAIESEEEDLWEVLKIEIEVGQSMIRIQIVEMMWEA